MFNKIKTLALGVIIALAIPLAASANCLTQSQNAIAGVQLLNAASISRYTWAGDPQYDQKMPLCSKTALREFGCNIVVNVAIRDLEDKAATHSKTVHKSVCIANYIGAAAFGYYIRKAVNVQLFGSKF